MADGELMKCITVLNDCFSFGKTNYGICRFTTRMGGDAVIALSDCRYQITDLDGNRYEIVDLYKLSVNERKKLDLFI